MRFSNLCLIFLLFIFGGVSAQHEVAFEFPHPRRLAILDSVFLGAYLRNADTALIHQKLKNIADLATAHKDEQSLLLSELFLLRLQGYYDIKYEKNQPGKLDALLIENQKIIKKAIVKKYHYLQILIYIQLGSIMRQYGKMGAGLGYDLKAFAQLDSFLKDSRDNVRWKTRRAVARRIGMIYYDLEENEKAAYYIQRAIGPEFKRDAKAKKDFPAQPHYNLLNFDMLSQAYLRLGQYDSSEHYIQKAYTIYINEDTTLWHFNGWRGILTGNRGNIFYKQKQYAKAIPLYKEGITLTEKAKLYDVVASFGISLAYCYLNQNDYTSVKSLLPVISRAIDKMNPNKFIDRGKQKINIDYYKLLMYLPPSQDFSIGTKLNALDSIAAWTERLQVHLDQDFRLIKELGFEMEHIKSQEVSLLKSIEQEQRNRNKILYLVLFIGMTGAVVMYYKQKQLKQEKLKSRDAIESADLKLKLALDELEKFKETISYKTNELEKFASKNRSTPEDNLFSILTDGQLNELEWKKISSIFESAHPEYLDRLKVKYPFLTPSEINLIILLKIKLNTKEMATALGVSPGAIRTSKSRLLKKLGQPEGMSVEEIVGKV